MKQYCRFCKHDQFTVFANLGMSPLANSYITEAHLNHKEPFYPLTVYACNSCLLVQLQEFESPEHIFGEYAYFSSFSTSWLEHAKQFADMAIRELGLSGQSQVVEIASNDGYLLQFFKDRNIPAIGIEPAENVAKAARSKGIDTRVMFFGVEGARNLLEQGVLADLLIGNNVLAHVPDLNDFVAGLKLVLKSNGVITMEFPHLLKLIEFNQFDTIYHEHFSYFSLLAANRIFQSHGLRIVDVEELPTHGGSLRIYAKHDEVDPAIKPSVHNLLHTELMFGMDQLTTYDQFSDQIKETKRSLLELLIDIKKQGKRIVGYGAPAKGNTLLNYCGIGSDFLDFTVDANPNKQGKYLPGTRIPIYSPDKIAQVRPDYVLILPWNLKEEIMDAMKHIEDWNGKFIVPVPRAEVI